MCSPVPSQQSHVSDGVLSDEQLSPAAPGARRPPLAGGLPGQQLLQQPSYALCALRLTRRHLHPAGPTEELRVRTLPAFPWICLHQRRGHHRVGQVANQHTGDTPDSQSYTDKYGRSPLRVSLKAPNQLNDGTEELASLSLTYHINQPNDCDVVYIVVCTKKKILYIV